MLKPFLQALRADEARGLLKRFTPLDTEQASIDHALFRVVAELVKAGEDWPSFDRSTMDGFAVRSVDTFGATETMPGLFTVVAEIAMGEVRNIKLKRGEVARIWTGGALPSNADAVVMVEHAEELDSKTIEVLKAVPPFDNVVRKGEDFKRGETLLGTGHRLRAQDLGLLAAMGRSTIRVHRRPSVAVISSGDEIVPIENQPPAGCVRDVNRHTLSASIREAHAEPVWIGIAPDKLHELCALIHRGIQSSDMVLISGGSSMGSRDLVIEAIQSFDDAEILLHGVAVSPGKPLILARIGHRPIVGLPGHPVSALVCFEQFVVPLIRRLEGEDVVNPFLRPTVRAILSRNVPSREGRLDFIRVRLQTQGDGVVAVPVPGKSGVISAMVRAHGCVRIEADCEGLYKGDEVTVSLFADWIEESLEKKHIPRHEATRRGPGDIFGPSQQEKLSTV